MIADLAGSYRIPVALHDVGGLLLNLASQQLGAAIFNCPRIECSRGAASLKWANPNPLAIQNGRMKVSDRPGLGVDLDQDYLRANLAPGEPWWR
jgi:L-alanine-DL-glutamate epimerase-like enolase superfamily enzyme